jgi:hypothetical protein
MHRRHEINAQSKKELNHTEYGGSMSVRQSGNSIPITPNINPHNIVMSTKTLLKSKSHIHKKSLQGYCLTFHCSVVMCWRELRKRQAQKNCAVFALTTSTTRAPPCLVRCLYRNGHYRKLPRRRHITIVHHKNIVLNVYEMCAQVKRCGRSLCCCMQSTLI